MKRFYIDMTISSDRDIYFPLDMLDMLDILEKQYILTKPKKLRHWSNHGLCIKIDWIGLDCLDWIGLDWLDRLACLNCLELLQLLVLIEIVEIGRQTQRSPFVWFGLV